MSALFVRADSIYKQLPGVDAWDEQRDARNWPGGTTIVAHPPCRGWGRLRQFSYASEEEKRLAVTALEWVRVHRGVLEHPAESRLWIETGIARPGKFDGIGYSIEVDQFHWGHRAEKRTWLYIVGCPPDRLPEIPVRDGKPTHCVRPTKKHPRLPSITKPEREHTPRAFAEWLVEVARRAAVTETVIKA